LRRDISRLDITRLDGARAAARGLLWVCVALVFMRGVSDLVRAAPSDQARPRWSKHRFPGDEARAFAVAFTRSYLTVPQPKAVDQFFADGLRDGATLIVSPRSPGVQVTQATVAREVSLGGSRALFTVAAFTNDGRVSYLTVPVAVDDRGGLAVDDLPAFAAPPRSGAVPAQAPDVLAGEDERALGALVRRFLDVYLHGESEGAFGYLTAPGARIAPMGSGLRLVAIDELAQDGQGMGRRRVVMATVRVRASGTGVIYPQRYRLTVVCRDRWFVAAVAGGPGA
jgi:hypothetical protein